MLKTLNAAEFKFHETQAKEGEERSCQIPLPSVTDLSVDVEIRCSVPVVLNLINQDGLTLFVEKGLVVAWSAKVTGFVALEVVTTAQFAYRIMVTSAFFEANDGRSLTVEIDESTKKPIEELVKAELAKYLGRYKAHGILGDDVSVQELLDDIDSGDLEFEEEPDMFGLGYEERHAAFERRQAEMAAEGDDDEGEDTDPPAEPKKPASKPVSAPKEKQDSLPLAGEKQ